MNAPAPRPRYPILALILAIVLIGVAAGLGAAALSLLIHGIEYLAFGQSEADVPIVTDGTTAEQRLIALAVGGVVVGLGWWALQRWGRPVVTITGAVAGDTPARRKPPFLEHILHAVLQIVAVGAGAPIGREVAPRELGAVFAAHISDALRIDPENRRVLVACGAAAGLAGVYHVPFAGAIFALEILLGAFSIRLGVIALTISVIATLVARIEVSPATFYSVVEMDTSMQGILWSAAVGALLGLPAALFRRAVAHAEAYRARGISLLLLLPLAFILSGVVAILMPQVLGNGRAAAQTAFDANILLPFCVALLFGKMLLVLLTLRSGAFGGTLTPGLAIGAVGGLALGLGAQLAGASPDLPTTALAGAVAFLAVSMNAPLTAFALIVGFTGEHPGTHLPLLTAVVTAMAMAQLLPRPRQP